MENQQQNDETKATEIKLLENVIKSNEKRLL